MLLLAMGTNAFGQNAPVDFAAQVEPILAKHCYSCHGSEAHKGGLRLHTLKDATLGGDSGTAAYTPGKSGESLLVQRILSTDPDERMPLNADPLPESEIAIIRAWIDAGASWGASATAETSAQMKSDHWAFQRPVQTPIPAVQHTTAVRNPIDAFIVSKVEQEGLSPAPEADRYTLIRRATLDLTGLPPTPAEIDAFVNDPAPDAYERLVDRLLTSPHYGERMAVSWLDAARYADTNGFEKDRSRSMWPYRDWVINAFNDDMPFDQFVVEQLAGDLLPNPTLAQRIATGFHCNTMLNEEGGVDVEEYRYEAMVDRTNTTATVFLGLTMACAQCHTHKYDPISQREYFQFFAFLNNTDDTKLEVPTPELTKKRAEAEAAVAQAVAELESKFPEDEAVIEWAPLQLTQGAASSGAVLTASEDATLVASGPAGDKETYTLTFALEQNRDLSAIRLEALATGSAPHGGPGRAENGNFVLSEIRARIEPTEGKPIPLKIAGAEASHSQPGFEVARAVDGDSATGWAVDGAPNGLNQDQFAAFTLATPISVETPSKLVVELVQDFGASHVLGKLRVSAGHHVIPPSAAPASERRAAHLARRLTAWQDELRPRARRWTQLKPLDLKSRDHATFRKLADNSVLVTGDNPNNDIYEITYQTDLQNITGIRIEALPDPSLPGGGPGRGVILAEGDFLLSETSLQAAPWLNPDAKSPVTLTNPTESYAGQGRSAALTLDGKTDTGWAIHGQEGRPNHIVYAFEKPIHFDGGTLLALKLDQIYIHNHTIGRFRVSVTTDPLPVEACPVPAEIESTLATPTDQWSEAQHKLVKNHFLSVAPELAKEHKRIAELRDATPKFPTTLVLTERDDTRVTNIHNRGEFLSPRDPVGTAVPAVLPPLPQNVPANRLTFARWLVAPEQPLTARVTVNRLWMSCFGRGLVNTPEDFGLRGEKPSHPELLDWLAVEFMRRGWSQKEMMRLFVTSATYRQASNVSPALVAADPANEWLARGPRFRVDAEYIRDIALTASGQIDLEIGGPSVFPPIPEGALSLVYPGEGWNVSDGTQKFRRAIYTSWKRTMPYPAATVFDAATRDSTCVRRVRSNTPLQSLTLLNDGVFMDAARAMASRLCGEADKTPEGRIRLAYLLCLARPPDAVELDTVKTFWERQRTFYAQHPEEAKVLAASETAESDMAAWILVCRALLNLDETITKG